MSEIKVKQSLENLGKALARLKEGVTEAKDNRLMIDGTIQRFEFTLELYWKTLKRLLELDGIITYTPKEALQKAYQAEWLNEENVWLQMLKDRNETSHIYNEQMADRIYRHIQLYLPIMEETYQFLLQRFNRN